jgi:hypothetical protein
MNHLKIYNLIVENARLSNRVKLKKDSENYVYYEKHHIIPRCLGGTNDEQNLVLLTPKEHYVLHKLLTKIYPTSKGIRIAFRFMSVHNKKIKISSRDYAHAKEYLGPISEETREKMSIAAKGRKRSEDSIRKWKDKFNEKNDYASPMKGKHMSKEAKEKIRTAVKGRIVSEETKLKMGNSRRGKTHTLESKLKISMSHIGITSSDESKNKNRISHLGKRKDLTNKLINEFPS